MKTLSRPVCLLIFVLWTLFPARAEAQPELMDLIDLGLPPAILCEEPCDPPAPLVTVKVRVPACAPADNNLEYRILVENRSPAAAHKAVVLDRLPANARFVRASPQPHKTEPELQWQLGTLKANSCQEITLVLTPTNAEDVANCVRVQFEHGVCVCTRRSGSPSPLVEPKMPPPIEAIPKKPKTTTDEPPLAIVARLEVDVKGPNQQNLSDPARYVITVTNVGNAPARKVAIESIVSEKLLHVSASDKGVRNEDTVFWLLGDLQPKSSRNVEVVVKAKEAGVFCIKTRAVYDDEKPAQVTPFKEKCTSFHGPTGLLLEMYDREDPIPVNGATSYPITVYNQGKSPATNIRIEAQVPTGMEFVRATGPADYKVEGKTVLFAPVATLEAGATLEYEVYTRARVAGDLRFKIQMTADQLKEGGPVREEESTTVYSEDVAPRMQNRGSAGPLEAKFQAEGEPLSPE